MDFIVLTLFPDMIRDGLHTSITGRRVDDYPYGGGAGMLIQAQPVYDAYQAVAATLDYKPRVVYLTPQGKVFNQSMAKELAVEQGIVFLCGHYEGVDERVLEEIVTDNISIGDFVLTGGELPAMCMIDAISRMIPGVLHNEESDGGVSNPSSARRSAGLTCLKMP